MKSHLTNGRTFDAFAGCIYYKIKQILFIYMNLIINLQIKE